MREIGIEMAHGAAWMVLFKIAQRSLSVISTLILVRLLLPSDFGLIAMSVSLVALLEHLSAFKFDIVLIQKQTVSPADYNTAWTFNVVFGLLNCALLLLLARPAAVFYSEPNLAPVMICLAFVPLVQGLENIGVVMFRKEMKFNLEFRYLFAKRFFGFCITVPLAFILRNYWALVAGMMGGQIGATALSYFMHRYRPKFSFESARELFHFSKWLAINSVLGFLRLRSADFIVGKTTGTRALGFYNIAFDFSTLVTSQIAAPVNRAVFAGLSTLKGDYGALRQNYLAVLSMLSAIMVPAAIGIAAVAAPFVQVVLGAPWTDVTPLIEKLALVGLFSATATNSLSVYLAVARPWLITVLHGSALLLAAPLAVVLGTRYGANGAAMAYLIVAAVFVPVDFLLLSRIIDLKLQKIAAAIWRPMVAGILMFAVVRLFLGLPAMAPSEVSQVLRLVSSVILGLVTYVGSVSVLWMLASRPGGAERIIVGKIMSVLDRTATRRNVD